MSGIVQIGGVALASHNSGTDKVSLDSGTVFPAGHIVQTANDWTGSTSITFTGGSTGQYFDTGVQTSLTPANGNKILVLAQATIGTSSSGENTWRIQRKIGSGSWGHPTVVATQADAEGVSQVGGWYDSGSNFWSTTTTASFLDSPASALECFYRIDVLKYSSSSTVYLNRPPYVAAAETQSGITSITLMEVQQ